MLLALHPTVPKLSGLQEEVVAKVCVEADVETSRLWQDLLGKKAADNTKKTMLQLVHLRV